MNLDWQAVVLNIRSAGLSVTAQARRVGMAPQTLRHFARGECSEPRFSQGLKLLDLHHQHCPEKHNITALTAGVKARSL